MIRGEVDLDEHHPCKYCSSELKDDCEERGGFCMREEKRLDRDRLVKNIMNISGLDKETALRVVGEVLGYLVKNIDERR